MSETFGYIKRALAVFAALCLLLSLAGCKEEEEREMKSYADEVGGYTFSYPEGWDVYSLGGVTCISIADVGGALPFAMVRFSSFDNAEGLTAAEYWNAGVDGFSSVYESCRILQDKRGVFEKDGVDSAYSAAAEVTLKGETKLDGQPKKAGETADYMLQQLVFEGDGRICVVSYLSSKTNYELYGDIMDDIKESFAFADPAPLQSADDKGYTDFTVPVPEGWSLDTAEAFVSLSYGKATVVACVFALDRNAAARQYWEETYKNSVSAGLVDFKEISVAERRLGGASAVDVYYTAKSVSGNSYSFRTCLCIRGAEVYTVTLTADENDYEGAAAGYEAILEGFAFK